MPVPRPLLKHEVPSRWEDPMEPFISSHRKPSEAIRGHQWPSEAIRGHQRPSEAIRSHQRQTYPSMLHHVIGLVIRPSGSVL